MEMMCAALKVIHARSQDGVQQALRNAANSGNATERVKNIYFFYKNHEINK